jgi:hypothetical protein
LFIEDTEGFVFETDTTETIRAGLHTIAVKYIGTIGKDVI